MTVVVDGLQGRAVVVGAGPSGALAAINLARAGCQVQVYERAQAQPMGPNLETIGPRSYNIVLNKRGLMALQDAGVDTTHPVFMVISTIARYLKTKTPIIIPATPTSRMVNRGALAGHLIAEAVRLHPERIKVHLGAVLEDLRLDDKQATFLLADGTKETVSYDLLVGSDGASSRVRSCLQQQVPGFSFTQRRDTMEYKAFEMPSLEHADPDYHKRLSVVVDAATNSSLIASPSNDGKIRGAYGMNKGGHDAIGGFDGYVQKMKESFPCFLEEQYPAMAAQLVEAPVSDGGWNTRCSQLHGPSVVLVGDAGHSMWPTLGQGANSALESAAVLGTVLNSCKDLSQVPEQYNKARHADALAIVELTERGWGHTNKRTVTLNKLNKIQLQLHTKVPWLVPKPVLMTLPTSLRRYSEMLRASERHVQVANLMMATMAVTAIAAGIMAIKTAVPLLRAGGKARSK